MVVKAQEPTSHASNLVISDTFCSSVTLRWTNGNGASRIVIASEGTVVSSLPTDNIFYFGGDYGSGTRLGNGQYAVYSGTGSFAVIENLKKNTTYYFSVFEFSNNSGGNPNYLTSTGYPESSVTTKDISVSFTIDDPYQCENVNQYNFTSVASQDPTGPINYLWRFGDGNTATTPNASHSYASYGLYEVSLIASSLKCADTMVRNDTVAPIPEFIFDLLQDSVDAGYTQDQCFVRPDGRTNAFFFYTSTSFKPLGRDFIDETVFYWKFGDGNVSDETVFEKDHSYAEPGTYIARLIQTTTNNRIEYCIDSLDFVVTVFPSPIDSSLIRFDSVLCLDNNLFSFEHNNVNPSISNRWSFGDGNVSAGSQVTHSYASAGVYGFELDAEDQNGCTGNYKDTIEVVPQPNNTISGLDARYCLGDDPVQLSVTISTGEWIAPNLNTTSLQFNPVTLGENTLRYAVDVDGCKDTAEVVTEVFPVPEFELGRDTSFCLGESLLLSIGKDSSQVSWSNGSNDSFTTVTSGGLLWAKKISGGCPYSDSIIVSQITAPSVDLGVDSTLCGDGVRRVDVQAAEAEYTWNDGYSGGGQRYITASGEYILTVTNKCGTDSDDVLLEFLPYVCDIFVPSAFTPNGDGQNDVFRPRGNVEVTSMEIYNRWGELLYTDNDESDGFSWDGFYEGNLVQQGHYYFIIGYLFPVNDGQLKEVISGEVYVLH